MRKLWKKHGLLSVVVIFLLIIFCMTAGNLLYIHVRVFQAIPQGEDTVEYSRHIAFIADDGQDSFWNEVYESARQEGAQKGYYVEAFGQKLSVDYTKTQLFSIALQAGADAVILQGNDIEDSELWQEAAQKEIPVITVLSDITEEGRTCFVGVNSYNLGQLYGREVLSLLGSDKNRIYVLMNKNTTNTSQNIIYSGIRDVLESEAHCSYELLPWAIQAQGTFETEETVRDIFMSGKELPDILICLDKLGTTSACQSVVDFNKVGDVNIIGCYTSDAILHAIKQEVLHATIDFDTQGMGINCIDALDMYWQEGHVSSYIPVSANLITVENVEDYMADEE